MALNIDENALNYMRENGINSIEELLGRTTQIERTKKYFRKEVEYSMETVLNIIVAIGKGIKPEFIIDEQNISQYKELVKYFFGDKTFKGDLQKGILLRGRKGTGKTMAMIVFKKLIASKIYPLRNIINYSVEDHFDISIVRTKTISTSYEINGMKNVIPWTLIDYLCLDDLGEESKNVKHYANNANVMIEVLTERYFKFIQIGQITFATTNYTYESKGIKYFKDFYGVRTEDRMKEMFNEIVFTGESRRK